MSKDCKIIQNEKIVQQEMSKINCQSCKYYVRDGCRLYFHPQHECLILIEHYIKHE